MNHKGGEKKEGPSISATGGGQPRAVAREEDVLALAEALRAFSGDREQGLALRARLASLGQVRMRSEDPAVLAVRKAATLAQANRIDGDFGVGLDEQEPAVDSAPPGVARMAYLAPFLGIESEGAAAYHFPLTIDDQPAVAWASYMASHPVIPDERMLNFLMTLLDVRPRHLWRAAAEALAALAARGEASARDRLLARGEQFKLIRPAEPPLPVTPGVSLAATDASDEKLKHLRRHVRYAIACWLARGTPDYAPPPLRAEIPALRLPRDPTEASIEVLCLGARLRGERDRDTLLGGLPQFLGPLDADPVMEDALRFLYRVLVDYLVDCEARGASVQPALEALTHVERLLGEPSWLGRRDRVTTDLLWSWLASISLLANRHQDLEHTLAARFPDLAALVRFRREGHRVADPVAEIMPRLRDLLDPARFAAKARFHKALCVCETAVLLEHPDLAPLDWRALVSASLGTLLSSPRAGTVAEVGLTELLAWLASLHGSLAVPGLTDTLRSAWFPEGELARYLPLQVIRDRAADPDTIIALAAARHGWLVNQVAVQAERRLRRLQADPAEQIRFLWRLLEVDPLDKVFTELRQDLRGTDTKLHSLVEAIGEMDKARGKSGSDEHAGVSGREVLTANKTTLQKTYDKLVNAAVVYVEDAAAAREDVVGLLRAALKAIGILDQAISGDGPPDVRLRALCQAIDEALSGGADGQGLATWFAWVDGASLETANGNAWHTMASIDAPRADNDPGQSGVKSDPLPSAVGVAWSNARDPTRRRRDLERCAEDLLSSVEALFDNNAGWVPDLLDQALAACARLDVSLEGAPWPERIGLSRALRMVSDQLKEFRQGASAQQALADRIAAWVDARDTARLAEVVRAAWDDARDATHLAEVVPNPLRVDLAMLRPALLEATHKVLLESGDDELVRCAEKLRHLCRGKNHARLPPIVEHYIRERRTDQVVEVVDASDQHADLETETLARVNDFLLERLYLGRAARVRKTVARRLRAAQEDAGLIRSAGASELVSTLPRSWLMHLAPLSISVPAGTLLVLDVGMAWSEVLQPGYHWAFYGTLSLCLLLSFITLVGGLARHTTDDARQPGFAGWTTWVRGMIRRALPVFLGAWVLAFICSLAVLLSLAGTSVTMLSSGTCEATFPLCLVKQTVLWSSLSLFLGIFLGLIAQGRGLYGHKGMSTD